MGNGVSISEVADCLQIEGRAVSSVADYRSLYQLACDEAKKRGKTKILLVVHQVDTIPLAEIYFAASQHEQLGTQPDYKIAVVSMGTGYFHAEQFFAMVASNRGADIQAFQQLESAKRWLSCGDQ